MCYLLQIINYSCHWDIARIRCVHTLFRRHDILKTFTYIFQRNCPKHNHLYGNNNKEDTWSPKILDTISMSSKVGMPLIPRKLNYWFSLWFTADLDLSNNIIVIEAIVIPKKGDGLSLFKKKSIMILFYYYLADANTHLHSNGRQLTFGFT